MKNFNKPNIKDAFCVIIELILQKNGKILIALDNYRQREYN